LKEEGTKGELIKYLALKMLHFECKSFQELSLEILHHLLMLRSEVFVVEQNCVYQDIDGKDIEAKHILGFNKKKELVGYARILPAGLAYSSFVSIGRVVVKKNERKKNYGHELISFSLNRVSDLYGKVPIKISAQSHLIAFYNTHGFKVEGKEYLEDGIPHTAMVLKH
jgi:ElaA protein